MEEKITYPIGQQDFGILRKDNNLYIDKTQYIERIILSKQKYFFLSRPRRFGKSLFLSTLRYFFEGERELFKGLHINRLNWDWQPYPVLRIDLNTEKYESAGMLEGVLNNTFLKWEEKYGISNNGNETISTRFQNIIEQAHVKTGRLVVILVDEYDKPLVGNLNNDENYEHYRMRLASLYSNFKSSAEHIRLVFLTGVSRFSKLSVFSDLNNLNDITFDNDYSAICGITDEELTDNLRIGIHELGNTFGLSYEDTLRLLKENYDGYRFSTRGSNIYNPWSVLCCLSKREILNYWSMTGKPTLIAQALKNMDVDLEKTLSSRFRFRTLAGLHLKHANPTALLYQTGYLTIKSYDFRTDTVSLGIPNKEVKESLLEELLPFYVTVNREEPVGVVFDIIEDVREGHPEKLVKDIDIFLSGIPYEMKMEDENNLHNAIYILLTLIGIEAETEIHTSDGRIDLIIKTSHYIYIIELKFGKSAQEAMDQIEEKQYALPYANDSRRLFKIGINFSPTTRRLDPPIIN